MIKKWALLYCCFLIASNFSMLLGQEFIEDHVTYFKEITSKYSPDASFIYRNTPRHAAIPFTSNHIADLLNDLPTQIHEDYHILNAFDNQNAEGYRVYRLASDLTIAVPLTTVYNSRELMDVVPGEHTMRISTFDVYIEAVYEPEHDAQINGIYGLLEEMLAYYQGAKTYVDLYPCVIDEFGYNNPLALARYLSSNSADISAYVEFKLMISWYLQHAKQTHPAVYEQLIQNQPLKVIYSLVDQKYAAIVEQYQKISNEILANQSSSKYDLVRKYNEINIVSKQDGKRKADFKLHDLEVELGLKQLANKEHEILQVLNLEGLTPENYGTFLK